MWYESFWENCMPRVIVVVGAALLSVLGSGAYAQTMPPQVAQQADPNKDKCASWRHSMQENHKLSPDDKGQFNVLCVQSEDQHGIVRGYTTYVPFPDKGS
jgi:hypothetical protein